MSIVIVPDGALVTQDPSDQVFYQFDWNTNNLSSGVGIDTSQFKVTGLNTLGTAIHVPVASLQFDGSFTITATTTAAHGFSNGDWVTISGVTAPFVNDMNYTYAVTVINTTIFQYFIGLPIATPFTAEGTILALRGIDEVSILTDTDHDARYTQFRFTNNVAGARYRISNYIVTNETPTQTKERSFDLLIQDR